MLGLSKTISEHYYNGLILHYLIAIYDYWNLNTLLYPRAIRNKHQDFVFTRLLKNRAIFTARQIKGLQTDSV